MATKVGRAVRWIGFGIGTAAAIASAGCHGAGAPAPAITVATATAPRPAPPSPPEGGGWLVWGVPRDPGTASEGMAQVATMWVDDHGAIVASRNGLFVAIDGALWRWDTEAHDVRFFECAAFDDGRSVPTTGHGERASLVRVDGAGRTAAAFSFAPKFGEDGDETAPGDLREGFDVVGSVGPLLFVVDDVWTSGCGAHGTWGAQLHVVDARTGEDVAIAFPDAGTPAVRARAQAELPNDVGPDVTCVLEDGPVATVPRVVDHAMTFEHVFLADVPYAYGATRWSSYAVDVHVPAASLPDALGRGSRLPMPAAVAGASDVVSKREIRGWTRIAPSDTQRLRAAFGG